MSSDFNPDYDAGSPSENEKKRIVSLSFECTRNKANSFQDLKQMYSFNENVEDLMYRLLRFMPIELKKEIESMFDEMAEQIKRIEGTDLTEQKKQKEIIENKFNHFKKIHRINTQVLPRSTVFERDVYGELDVEDLEAIKQIREEKGRNDEIPAQFGG